MNYTVMIFAFRSALVESKSSQQTLIETWKCEDIYRKFAIGSPAGIQSFATHNFLTTYLRIITLIYSDRKNCILSEYNYIIVLRCVVQKLYVEKESIPLVYLSQIYGNPNLITRKKYYICRNQTQKKLGLDQDQPKFFCFFFGLDSEFNSIHFGIEINKSLKFLGPKICDKLQTKLLKKI